jgi:hypothetical protein
MIVNIYETRSQTEPLGFNNPAGTGISYFSYVFNVISADSDIGRKRPASTAVHHQGLFYDQVQFGSGITSAEEQKPGRPGENPTSTPQEFPSIKTIVCHGLNFLRIKIID